MIGIIFQIIFLTAIVIWGFYRIETKLDKTIAELRKQKDETKE